MRQMGLAWVAIAGLTVLGAPIAEAGVTCKIIPSWCPQDNHGSNAKNNQHDGDTTQAGSQGQSDTPTKAPEPATFALLGVGAAAVGFATRRRRKS